MGVFSIAWTIFPLEKMRVYQRSLCVCLSKRFFFVVVGGGVTLTFLNYHLVCHSHEPTKKCFASASVGAAAWTQSHRLAATHAGLRLLLYLLSKESKTHD